ncbi:hypothetical protein GCM10011584_13440 [Nocardioides phosphati]|uniref:Lipoprotein n=1 Tax=Nocardioides phosphati TaxID=1867775 RepID=A0ABQ2N908_9ACTN|nr:hypothetical protein [Nocardioides phosphati]GGO87845.1 hypothetical protein GCM10011584_13440 [Nocardioides phosphati]
MARPIRNQVLTGLALVLVALLALSQAVDPSSGTAPTHPRTVAAEAPRPPLAPALRRPELFDGRMFVAYYGTVGTPVLGVLGESTPEQAFARVRRAAAPFRRAGLAAQPVFELIVTVADSQPGPDGDYNHDVPVAAVRRWVEAARRSGALLVLDLQPGRADFPSVAKRWEWALRDPNVGLALDPEWRMHGREVPGRVIGSVTTWEVNLTSRWLEQLVEARRLPEKLFVVHQFRRDMLRGPHRVEDRRHLAEVQHVDGFGTPREKLATYAAVARPGDFRMGFKLFYDEDRPRLSAAQVMRIRPRVDFVSFQ